MYVCGGSTGFNCEVWKTSGKGGGVRRGEGVGESVVVGIRVSVGVKVGLGELVAGITSAGTGNAVAGPQAARVKANKLKVKSRRTGNEYEDSMGRILPGNNLAKALNFRKVTQVIHCSRH